jgi:hypothetical protein
MYLCVLFDVRGSKRASEISILKIFFTAHTTARLGEENIRSPALGVGDFASSLPATTPVESPATVNSDLQGGIDSCLNIGGQEQFLSERFLQELPPINFTPFRYTQSNTISRKRVRSRRRRHQLIPVLTMYSSIPRDDSLTTLWASIQFN